MKKRKKKINKRKEKNYRWEKDMGKILKKYK